MTDHVDLFSVYDKEGSKKARFEDQYGLVNIRIGEHTINVFDTHAETMWFSTVQTTPDEMYPDRAAEDKGNVLLVGGSQYLVPPNPHGAGKFAEGQGPVYRILEEETLDGVAMGYISRNPSELPAIDYFEGLYDDVSTRAPRVAGSVPSAGGVLFPVLQSQGATVVEQAQAAKGRVLHVFNKKGVAQRLATQHFKLSKRTENLTKWSEAAARGDFKNETRFRFIFGRENADGVSFYHIPGFNKEVTSGADLGFSGWEGNMIKSLDSSSPAASVGINTDAPWAYLDKGDYPVLKELMKFYKISWSANEDQAEGEYAEAPFSPEKLDAVLRDEQPSVLLLWREPLADEALVRTALDDVALQIRDKELAKLQDKADKEGWFIAMEKQPLTAWPPGDNEEGRQGVGPFPADWPGYYFHDEDGAEVEWDPSKHADPQDDDFYAREFVKQYSYVLARGSKKGPSGPSGDKWMGMAGLYAALFGYNNTQNKSAQDLADLFPDRNADARAAYTAGLVSQIPKSYVNVKAGDEEAQYKASLLRFAFVMGLNFSNKKAEDLVPSTDKLRATYKDGKRAVAVGITEEIWQGDLAGGNDSGKMEMYQKLAAPVELNNVGSGSSDEQELREKKNYLLRKVWEQGVKDAWEGRKQGELTSWTALKRIPDAADDVMFTSLIEAFKAGAEAAKKAVEVLAGSDLTLKQVVEAPQMTVLETIADGIGSSGLGIDGTIPDVTTLAIKDAKEYLDAFRSTAKRAAFVDGLDEKWAEAMSTDGSQAAKADDRYPFTFEDLLKAFEDGVTQRARDDKKKNAEVEDVAEEEKDACLETTLCILTPFYVPCTMCYDMCCVDMCTTDEETGKCMLCGTTCSDWLLILACFMFWYTFMGFWYWSLIEILLAVAEPQRPW